MMNRDLQKGSMLLYAPLLLLGIVLLVIYYSWQYREGVETGGALPASTLAPAPVVDHRALARQTDLATDGKKLFEVNCALCHGMTGNGDGPSSAGLNPKPRKYRTEKFKFGTDVVSIHNTIQRGSPGTAMPSFAHFAQRDIWALAHFVRTMIPSPDPTTDKIIEQLPLPGQPAAPVPSAASIPVPMDGRIPIKLAMNKMEQADIVPASLPTPPDHPAKPLYESRCAGCHGANGEGTSVKVLGVNPYRYTKTASLFDPMAAWRTDRAVFDQIVMQGLPGRVHPGNSALSRKQLDDLYDFVVNDLSPTPRAAVTQ